MVAYSFKRRFVEPIKVGLGLIVPTTREEQKTPKRQTIRAEGKRRHARPGETLQLYSGMRTKQCFKIGDARCTNVRPIRIRFGSLEEFDLVEIAGEKPFGDRASDIHKLDAFSYRDGFASWDALSQFWDEEHDGIAMKGGSFNGVLIEWEPIT